jgi:hypothetical protein
LKRLEKENNILTNGATKPKIASIKQKTTGINPMACGGEHGIAIMNHHKNTANNGLSFARPTPPF